MTAEEVIPDSFNSAHDPLFWCVPRMHDSPRDRSGGGYPMYLVTQGRQVGIWNNWTAAQSMVTGYPNAGYRGHHTVEGCVSKWQVHCALGVHPHPVDPRLAPPLVPPQDPVPLKGGARAWATRRTPAGIARPVDDKLQADLKKYCMPSLPSGSGSTRDALDEGSLEGSTSMSTCSSMTASEWAGVPAVARYQALWQCLRLEAKAVFVAAEAEGAKPALLSMDDYEEAEAYAEGVYWVED
ncbi:hypothetical protein B0H13DRAFT_2348670 [Mycena leptocephala]|nr:hypothetical protein B0H13DRAFT_2348670 [Mycena leptocephala]